MERAFVVCVLTLALLAAVPLAAVARQEQQDPRLERKLTLRLRKTALTEVLAEMQRRTGIAFRAAPETMALHAWLDRFALPVSRWERNGPFLRLRRHAWHWDRLAKVPHRRVDRWAALVRRERRRDLDDAARLAAELRDEQLRQLGSRLQEEGIHPALYVGGALFDPEDVGIGAYDILRACALLTPRERQALMAGGRLSVQGLPLAVRARLVAALQHRRRRAAGPLRLPPRGHLALTVETHRREVVAADGRNIRLQHRALDGPNAGQAGCQ
jgi:hypothetical protein